MPDSQSRPSPSLLEGLAQQLARHAPFAQMAAADVQAFVAASPQRYHAPGELMLGPDDGPVRELLYIRQGAVTGERGLADLSGGAFHYEAGDLFPVSAALAARPVTATYRAEADTFVLALPLAEMQALAARSAPFADFLNRRILQFVELSRRALQVAYASQALAARSLEAPLAELARRAPVTCRPDTPLGEALQLLQQRRVGSMLVTDEAGRLLGILTRGDVLGRITLPQVPLHTPIAQVMVRPVRSLEADRSADEAALLMSRHGIRHVPVTRDGVVVGIVSERDLFAVQRLSVRQIGASIRAAGDTDTLRLVAQDIRHLAASLLSQGLQARQLTALISHLNDALTERLLDLLAARHGLDARQACWLALGSEGRSEQTIATDQDNALLLADDLDDATRARWLALAREANQALDACGYPLCRGDVMAGNPKLNLPLRAWRERFAHWIEHGAPEDLLNASIFFDFRPLWGDAALAQRLRAEVSESARRVPRFLKQLALNALQHGVPLGWRGGIEADAHGLLDLKLRGTAIAVDAARLYALAHGVTVTSTRERLAGAGAAMGVPAQEYEGWIGAFEFLQLMRLRNQLDGTADAAQPNHVRPESLNDIDRRILKASLRTLRALQQRMQLDWQR